jgi:Ca2+-binding EF-hand superfamily protein
MLRALCATALIPLALAGCQREASDQPTAAASSAPEAAAAAKPMTREQATTAAVAMWNVMDSNHDGTIDQSDRDAQDDGSFKRMDEDGNGELSGEELGTSPEFKSAHAEGRAAWFKRLDTDKSGGLTRTEVAGGADDPAQRERAQRGRRLFEMGDANKDGRVTKAEYDTAVAQFVKKMDGDSNNTISPAEYEAASAELRRLTGSSLPAAVQAR